MNSGRRHSDIEKFVKEAIELAVRRFSDLLADVPVVVAGMLEELEENRQNDDFDSYVDCADCAEH